MTKSKLLVEIAGMPDRDPRLSRVAAALSDGNTTEAPARLVRRIEAAKRLGVTLRCIDRLAVSGALRRIRLPGRVRAVGFRESDVSAIIEGAAAQ